MNIKKIIDNKIDILHIYTNKDAINSIKYLFFKNDVKEANKWLKNTNLSKQNAFFIIYKKLKRTKYYIVFKYYDDNNVLGEIHPLKEGKYILENLNKIVLSNKNNISI